MTPRDGRIHNGESTGGKLPQLDAHPARIDHVYFASTLSDTSAIGFDDAYQYEDFAKPWAGEWRHAPSPCML